MSCYNWERGTIRIPSKEWKRVRDYIVGEANKRRAQTLSTAMGIHKLLSDRDLVNKARDAVKAINKGIPAKERIKLADVTPEAIFDAVNDCDRYSPSVLQRAIKSVGGFGAVKLPSSRWGDDENAYEERHAIEEMLFPRIPDEKGNVYHNSKRKRLAKPLKNDPAVKPIVATKVGTISDGEASLTFDHKGKALSWDVDENNRSVERAHQGWLWAALSAALGRVKWTRGSGGTLVGNDEYNRDDHGEDGGGNYVTHTFGPNARPKRRSFRDPYASAYAKSAYYGGGRRY